jgi:arginyl-tRNA synthetase
MARMMEFQGHKVIRQNHIGDWGTQFGMLIAYKAFKNLPAAFGDTSARPIEFLEKCYKDARALYDSNPKFAELGRKMVVSFQSGDADVLETWKEIVELSRKEIYPMYERLNVKLTRNDERGESFYNSRLPDVIGELQQKGLAKESDGAVCVFPAGFKNKDGEPLPLIIQKTDGAFLYATTDLAALRYRTKDLAADTIVYVTDARQKLHFEMLFAVARMAGWVKEDVQLTHVMFGSVMGEDGKPFKTRSGESVKLADLLDEAVTRARAVVEEKNPELGEELKGRIAGAVGIGAIKYADYSNNLTSDYVFSFDRMLAMEGNTAPYMQYAYARVKSIERKAVSKDVDIASELAGIEKLHIAEPTEIELAKHLLRYGEVIASAAADYRPNYLTAYLYDLASKFSAFYYACPVLQADAEKRPTRLMLCDLAARTIRHGLTELLGIEVVEQM